MGDSQDAIIANATGLPVRLMFARVNQSLIERARQLLSEVAREARLGRLRGPELSPLLDLQMAALAGPSAPVVELAAVQREVRRFWRAWPAAAKASGGGTEAQPGHAALLEMGKAISEELWTTCDQRISAAEDALKSLRRSTLRVAEIGQASDRRLVSPGRSVFLSYAHEDQLTAKVIERRLRAAGIPCWRDEGSLSGGAALPVEIANAIRNASHFCVLLSHASRSSRWVTHETSLALSSERGFRAPTDIVSG
jgi:hypothetical protein